MFLIRFQSKPFNITVIQVYAPITNAKEAEQFYEDLKDLLEVTPAKLVSLCPASFCTPWPNLRVTPGVS